MRPGSKLKKKMQAVMAAHLAVEKENSMLRGMLDAERIVNKNLRHEMASTSAMNTRLIGLLAANGVEVAIGARR